MQATNPEYYTKKNPSTGKRLEAIDVIETFTSELPGHEAWCVGNILKYLCRYKGKNGVEDLEKASWYLNRLIGRLEQ